MAVTDTIEINGEEREIADAYARGNINSLNNKLVEQKMLGWTVPSECPVQNYVDSDGIFHQIVGRVDLGSLDWIFYNEERCIFQSMPLANIKSIENLTIVPNLYVKGYTTVPSGATWTNKNISISIPTSIIICDTNYTTVEAFKNAMQGVYLYYELANPITMDITGSTALDKTNESLSDLEYLGWSVPDKCSLKNYKDTNEAFHQKVGRVFVDGNTSLSSYNITINGAVAISYSALGISLEEKKNIICCATLEPIIESEMINGKIGYHASLIDDFIYVNIKGSASSLDEFKASVNASPLVFYYKLDSEKIIIDGNEVTERIKNDLGGLKFSASGTTLTITDGANTWRLTAN